MIRTYHGMMPQDVRPKLLQPVHHGELLFPSSAVGLFGWGQRATGVRNDAQVTILPLLEDNPQATVTGITIYQVVSTVSRGSQDGAVVSRCFKSPKAFLQRSSQTNGTPFLVRSNNGAAIMLKFGTKFR